MPVILGLYGIPTFVQSTDVDSSFSLAYGGPGFYNGNSAAVSSAGGGGSVVEAVRNQRAFPAINQAPADFPSIVLREFPYP